MRNREITTAQGCLDMTAFIAMRNIENKRKRAQKNEKKNW